MKSFVVFGSAARTAASTNSGSFSNQDKGVLLNLDITASGGTTPTLDIKLQMYDNVGQKWVDMPGCAFAQKVSTGTDALLIYPGLGVESANAKVAYHMPELWRVNAAVGGGGGQTFTFSLSATVLQ